MSVPIQEPVAEIVAPRRTVMKSASSTRLGQVLPNPTKLAAAEPKDQTTAQTSTTTPDVSPPEPPAPAQDDEINLFDPKELPRLQRLEEEPPKRHAAHDALPSVRKVRARQMRVPEAIDSAAAPHKKKHTNKSADEVEEPKIQIQKDSDPALSFVDADVPTGSRPVEPAKHTGPRKPPKDASVLPVQQTKSPAQHCPAQQLHQPPRPTGHADKDGSSGLDLFLEPKAISHELPKTLRIPRPIKPHRKPVGGQPVHNAPEISPPDPAKATAEDAGNTEPVQPELPGSPSSLELAAALALLDDAESEVEPDEDGLSTPSIEAPESEAPARPVVPGNALRPTRNKVEVGGDRNWDLDFPRILKWGTAVLVLLLGGFLLFFAGGSGRLPVCLTDGVVLYQGKPAAGARITLFPIEKTRNRYFPTAKVAADGTFKLTTYEPDDGAPVGRYKVTVVRGQIEAEDYAELSKKHSPAEVSRISQRMTEDPLYSKYASPGESTLTAEIREGAQNHLEFKLD